MLREAAARPRARIIEISARKSTALLRFVALQDGLDLPRNLVDFRHAVNRVENALLAVIGQDRRGLGVIGGEPRLDRLGGVVGAAGKGLVAAYVANAGDFRLLVAVVIAGAAFRAGEAPGDAVDQRRVVDLHLDDMVEPA